MKILSEINCEELFPDQWRRLRDIRLESLRINPEAFGADYEVVRNFDEQQWREVFDRLSYTVAHLDGKDVSVMSIENLEGDFGATCWIGGCWSDPAHRGKGALRTMFAFLDHHAVERGWQKQGLGVWMDNFSAIAAYEKLGFVSMGEPQESTRKPGKFYQRMIRG